MEFDAQDRHITDLFNNFSKLFETTLNAIFSLLQTKLSEQLFGKYSSDILICKLSRQHYSLQNYDW